MASSSQGVEQSPEGREFIQNSTRFRKIETYDDLGSPKPLGNLIIFLGPFLGELGAMMFPHWSYLLDDDENCKPLSRWDLVPIEMAVCDFLSLLCFDLVFSLVSSLLSSCLYRGWLVFYLVGNEPSSICILTLKWWYSWYMVYMMVGWCTIEDGSCYTVVSPPFSLRMFIIHYLGNQYQSTRQYGMTEGLEHVEHWLIDIDALGQIPTTKQQANPKPNWSNMEETTVNKRNQTQQTTQSISMIQSDTLGPSEMYWNICFFVKETNALCIHIFCRGLSMLTWALPMFSKTIDSRCS